MAPKEVTEMYEKVVILPLFLTFPDPLFGPISQEMTILAKMAEIAEIMAK